METATPIRKVPVAVPVTVQIGSGGTMRRTRWVMLIMDKQHVGRLGRFFERTMILEVIKELDETS